MTRTAAEVFILQLARAGANAAHKFLAARGVSRSDRDDVVAAATLWCWEHRDNYSLTTTLETWFMNAIRDAYKTLRRGELPISDESLEGVVGPDTPHGTAAAESAAAELVRQLLPIERRVASLTMEGYTKEDMLDLGLRPIDIKHARVTIRRLRELLPDEYSYVVIARARAALSDDVEGRPMSGIDRELERLDFAPPAGKDCPPCWRCMYFEGYLPAGHRDTRMEIVDLEVRGAVKDTEARKIEIANNVRRGV